MLSPAGERGRKSHSTNLNESQRISTNLLSALAHVGARREVRSARCEVRGARGPSAADLPLRMVHLASALSFPLLCGPSAANLPLRKVHFASALSSPLLRRPFAASAVVASSVLLLFKADPPWGINNILYLSHLAPRPNLKKPRR